METRLLKELKERTEALSTEEHLELIAHLVERIRVSGAVSGKHRKWSEICGAAPYPLASEDAQTWVTRNRHSSNEHREKHWR